jgi:glucose-6-phosphate 1-epimerase
MDLKQIKDRFGSIKGAKVVEGNGGLLAVAVARDGVEGEVYLHGGHVTRWKPASTGDVLFLSDLTNWGATKAIRGGVPICFPWFGPKLDQPIGPQHGFARTREWKLEKIAEASDGIVVEVSDSSDEQTRRLWPHGFRIIHRVTFGPTLKMELEVQNTSEEQFTFEEAQHSYFQVGDVRQIAMQGLEGVSLVDKTEGPQKKQQRGDITFRGETDRVYLDATGSVNIEDPILKRRITVSKFGSEATVIWNPWIEKARALTDLGDDDWLKMVCVESCNLKESAIRLAAGQSHSMRTEVSITSG